MSTKEPVDLSSRFPDAIVGLAVGLVCQMNKDFPRLFPIIPFTRLACALAIILAIIVVCCCKVNR